MTYFQARNLYSNAVESLTKKKRRNLTWKIAMTSFLLTMLSQGKLISLKSRGCLCWRRAI